MKGKHRNELFKIEQGEAQEESLVCERPWVQFPAPHKNEQNKYLLQKNFFLKNTKPKNKQFAKKDQPELIENQKLFGNELLNGLVYQIMYWRPEDKFEKVKQTIVQIWKR